MTKKQRLILILMLAILAQAACTIQAAPLTSTTPTNPADACPTAATDLKLLVNNEEGYCLLYPAAYSAEVPHFIVINPVHAPGDKLGDAWVSIDVEPASGRTATQIADAEIAAAGPGFNITKSDIIVDGKPAVVVDGLPGPDPWRKVYIISNERLYTLTFLPWMPSTNALTPLEGLYKTTIDTFHFLPPK